MKHLLLAAMLVIAPGLAQAGGIAVKDAWSPKAPPAATVHAAFFTIANHGDRARSLIAVSAAGYAMARIHESRLSGGVMTMSAVDQIDIAPGAEITFQPGGLHVMLMKPTGPRAPGDAVIVTLGFADGEAVPVSVPVSMSVPVSEAVKQMKMTHGGS